MRTYDKVGEIYYGAIEPTYQELATVIAFAPPRCFRFSILVLVIPGTVILEWPIEFFALGVVLALPVCSRGPPCIVL